MKVIQLLSQIELTGAEVHSIQLAELLSKEGVEGLIISDQIHQPTAIPVRHLKIHNANFFVRWVSIFKLRKIIKTQKIDVVHAHSRAAVRVGFWATRFSPCALVSTLHGKQHYSLSKKIINLYGEKIIAICENIKEQFLQDFHVPSSRIQVIRNFFDFSRVKLAQLTPRKKDLNSLSFEKFVMSFLGRTSGPKGKNWEYITTHFCESWLREFPQLEIHFAGGPLENLSSLCQDQVTKLRATFPNRFHFHGLKDSLEELILSSDLVIAAGRIAVESAMTQTRTLCLGEGTYEGEIEISRLKEQLASNFGDILLSSSKRVPIPWPTLKIDIEKILSESTTSKINNERPLESASKNQLNKYLEEAFSQEIILTRIKSIYLSAIFKKKYKKNIPILMYHQVVNEEISSPHKIYITKENFEKHLAFLKKNHFTTLTFEELYHFKIGAIPLSEFPKKPLILTFDDGYLNNLTLALPLLKKYQMKAVLYLLASPHKTNFWDKNSGAPIMELLNLEQRKEVAKYFEIGSHGFDHKKLSQMTYEEAVNELTSSKQALEKEFNREIFSFAYTYGDRHTFSSFIAEKAGYKYAVNTTSGAFHFEDDPYDLFRVSIFPNDNESALNRKTRSWYRRYYYLKRKE